MKITNKSFRLDKMTKMALATGSFKDAHAEGDFRRIMVAAQVEAERVVKSAKPRGDNSERN